MAKRNQRITAIEVKNQEVVEANLKKGFSLDQTVRRKAQKILRRGF
jgi:hypothetical protein